MLCRILIVRGLLIMMGQHDRSEALFYYFRLEDQIPESHLLMAIYHQRLLIGMQIADSTGGRILCCSSRTLTRRRDERSSEPVCSLPAPCSPPPRGRHYIRTDRNATAGQPPTLNGPAPDLRWR